LKIGIPVNDGVHRRNGCCQTYECSCSNFEKIEHRPF
jgi:hypothetical protein